MGSDSKGKRSATSSPARAKSGAPATSASSRRARANALLALIARRKPRIVDEFHELGTALRELLEARLYEVLGHASFAELLEARAVMSLSSAKKLIAIAENLSRDAAVQLGRERAYALVAYAAATPDADSAATIAARDGAIGGRRLSTLSKRDIEAATRSARGRGRPGTPAERARRAALLGVKRLVKSWDIGAVDVALRGPRIVVSLTVEQAARLG
jgi:hypothetical protein